MTAWRMMFRTWKPTGWRPPAMRWFSLQWQDKEKLHATCVLVTGKVQMDFQAVIGLREEVLLMLLEREELKYDQKK